MEHTRSMKWRLPSLSALRTFEAAERHESFTKAAVELCLTQSAVSRQIRMMEEELGVELFQRVNQRLIVTEAGRIYASDVRRILGELQDSTVRLLSHQEQGGLLHLATPTVFGVKWLIPRLHSFYEKHPDILLSVSTRSQPADLDSEQLDVAIHWGNNDWPNVEAHPLVGRTWVPVCSPSYLESVGEISSPADLERATLLQHSRRPARWNEWFTAHQVEAANPWAGPRFEHFSLILQAALASLGVGLIPRMFIEDEVKGGRLVILFDDGFEVEDIYHVVYSEKKSNDPRIKKFRDWILSESRMQNKEENI